ncbi:MAG: anthranilate synthase component I family protein [Sedimentisphaerales bacterium]|jgi:para-aminobenzoate synthetase component 1
MTTTTLQTVKKQSACRLHSKIKSAEINPDSLSEIFSALPGVSILGGNSSKETADGFSYWMAMPKEVFEFNAGQVEPLEKLQKVLDKYKPTKPPLPNGLFTGGWVGFFGYELGSYLEPVSRTNTDDLRLPLIRLLFYDRLIAYDHSKKTFQLITLELDNDAETPQQKLLFLESLLNKARDIQVPTPKSADIENTDFSQVRSNMTKDYYLRAFEKIKRHIYDGDVYQINFSQRFDCEYDARPIDLFHWQNRYNPSPYSAYIDTGNFQIVSASPEMFITVKDGIISTKPIKGTRKRLEETSAETKQINAENLQQLIDSAKEKAELNMIIDLERNDLAHICVPGTRKVIQPRTIETYPSVFHAVATVAGKLRDNVNFCDILKAVFPGGSITGAPKIRSMQIINETEPTARGIYTGSIGYLGFDGSVCLNIAIRTIIIKNKSAYVQTGGGIVADSDPMAEWNETLVKARALLAGIDIVNTNCE